jgi:hypothetical protein
VIYIVKFRIYLRRFGKLIRTVSSIAVQVGLYVLRDGRGYSGSYDTYHEDGKFWSRVGGIKAVKYIRQPLSSFVGVETLSSGVLTVWGPMPNDRDESEVTVKPGDIVIDLEGRVGLEVILSSSVHVPLPDLPERRNSTAYVEQDWYPVLIVEVFEPLGNSFPVGRYPRREPWVEGLTSSPTITGGSEWGCSYTA